MSARFTAALFGPDPPTIDLAFVVVEQPSSATISELLTLAARGGPPRRELLWVSDLEGVQIGVVS